MFADRLHRLTSRFRMRFSPSTVVAPPMVSSR
jgi:hypothetical protein